MTNYQESIIKYVMKFSELDRDGAVEWCELNLIAWGEM